MVEATGVATDVLLLSVGWQGRALLRAQLVESGFNVYATDTWPSARNFLLANGLSGIAIVDLQDLPAPDDVLHELGTLLPPAQLIVLGAVATVEPDTLRQIARNVLMRPVSIGDIVDAAARVLSEIRRD